MSRRSYIIAYVLGIVAVFVVYTATAYNVIPNLGLNPNPGADDSGIPWLFAFVLGVVFLLPVLFLKMMMRFSRRVEGDDSHFNVTDIPKHQRRPKLVNHPQA